MTPCRMVAAIASVASSCKMADAAKVEAFREFGWKSHEAWLAYARNVELPGLDVDAAMLRVQARWYKRNIDPDFEVEWVTAQSRPARSQPSPPQPQPASTSSAPKPAPKPAAAPTTSGWGSRWGGSGSSATGAAGSQGSQQGKFALMHLMMVVLAFFHLIPVLPINSCSLRCYWWFMRMATVTQGYKVFTKFGAPPVWPFSWQAVQMWLSRAMASTDFFYAITCFAFMSTRSSLTLAMVPTLMAAARSLLAVASHQFAAAAWWQRTGGRLQAMVTSKAAALDQVAAWAELSLGFLLIVLLATPNRNFLLIFFYWNMLKMRYVTPESAATHRTAWSQLDQRTISFRQRWPLLEKAVQYIKSWFLNIGG